MLHDVANDAPAEGAPAWDVSVSGYASRCPVGKTPSRHSDALLHSILLYSTHITTVYSWITQDKNRRHESLVSITYNEDKKFETPKDRSVLKKHSLPLFFTHLSLFFSSVPLLNRVRGGTGCRNRGRCWDRTPGSCLPPGTLTFTYYLFIYFFILLPCL